MDKLIPVIGLFGIAIIGFILKLSQLSEIRRRHEFTEEYRDKFVEYMNGLLLNRNYHSELYYELTARVKEMQRELGSDGVYSCVQDRLVGYQARNYQMLINYLPETRSIQNDYENSILMERHNQRARYCDDMFIRHLGTLELAEENLWKSIWNPFSDFSEGVRGIITLPVRILKWFGFISEQRSRKIGQSNLIKAINFAATIVSFLSGVMAIVMGWSEFLSIIKTSFPYWIERKSKKVLPTIKVGNTFLSLRNAGG